MDLKKLKNKRVVIGVSGGPDSVYLLDLLAKNKVNLVVAHLNHGIRGKEGDADEKFVKELAKKYGCPFISKKVKIKGPGIEEKAREARYKFLRDAAKKHKAEYIALAHTLDDNIETVLLNITRGCGLKGLSGMREIQKEIIRPLINTEKKEILRGLKKHKLAYRTDRTNKDPRFTRNFMRLRVIPRLKKINPNLLAVMNKNIGNLREIGQFTEERAEKWMQKNVKNMHCPLKKFQNLHPVIQKAVLVSVFEKLNKTTKNLQKDHIDEILSIIKKGTGRKQKTFQNTRIEILNNNIVFSKVR